MTTYRSTSTRLALCALTALAMACATETDKDTDTDTDTTAETDTDTTADTDTDTTVDTDVETEDLTVGTFGMEDFTTGAPLAGATLTWDATTFTLDAEGETQISMPKNESYEVVFSTTDYPDFHFFGFTDADPGFTTNWALASDATLAQLEVGLGIELADGKGIVTVSVRKSVGDSTEPLAGATVALDVASDVALSRDGDSALGFSPGSTTLDSSSVSVIYFVNVPAGSFTPTVTPPAGYTCVVFPGTETGLSGTVYDGGFSVMTFLCDDA